MTAKELIEHLKDAAPNGDVLINAGGNLYEVRLVQARVDMDHAGTRHTTYLETGDEMAED